MRLRNAALARGCEVQCLCHQLILCTTDRRISETFNTEEASFSLSDRRGEPEIITYMHSSIHIWNPTQASVTFKSPFKPVHIIALYLLSHSTVERIRSKFHRCCSMFQSAKRVFMRSRLSMHCETT